ncbi:hypothetical protein [Spirosoma aerolatum]|uniref:hypothetical protein n=1 Tax=Spirosoma aerolatum TaxID=1211326 RepID=UPI0009AE344A|nr:hypothetical protein [Spirosoma aerolatum]
MNDLETIENYFAGRLPDSEKTRFEQQIVSDPELAQAVAFYIQAKQVARTEALMQRKADWEAIRRQPKRTINPTWVPFAYATAASILLILGFFLFRPQPSAQQLADRYIQAHLSILPVTMNSRPDSLQRAHQAYNDRRFAQADAIITALQRRDTSSAELLKIAGLVSLQQGNYDQAINQFHRLSQQANLRANPGLFYEALARLKRNRPDDKNIAFQLLNMVINKSLEGKKAALELVEVLD